MIKYEYLIGEKLLLSNQKQIEQFKFIYSPLGKIFEKQIKTVEDQGRKQIKVIQNQGQIKTTEFNKGVDNEFFEEFSHGRMHEIKDICWQIDLNNLSYYLRTKVVVQ